uniref:Secreted protein n=1 Tax=Parascaris univalens TaxID=6257 RepID=A0A915B5I9_PARUN
MKLKKGESGHSQCRGTQKYFAFIAIVCVSLSTQSVILISAQSQNRSVTHTHRMQPIKNGHQIGMRFIRREIHFMRHESVGKYRESHCYALIRRSFVQYGQ